jgi:hypothetical protein
MMFKARMIRTSAEFLSLIAKEQHLESSEGKNKNYQPRTPY